MVGFAAISVSALAALLAAIIYQTQLVRVVTVGFGIGRTSDNLTSFPYTCRRLTDEPLHACEDMWLSEKSRQLFLGCSDPLGKKEWNPHLLRFNASGRSLKDAFVVLDIDEPVGDGFRTRALKTQGFNDMLHFNGIAGHDDSNGDVRLWAVNAKPSADPETGAYLDDSKIGANMTIELFRAVGGVQDDTELEHVMTFSHPLISTPNRVAPVIDEDKHNFWITNDHGQSKIGPQYRLSPYLGTGDVTMCRKKACWKVAEGLRYPNGLVKGQDGLIYVPSSFTGGIDVFRHVPKQGFEKVSHIDTDFSLDNISVDKNGDLYVAAFPSGLKMLQGINDPLNSLVPAAALRIKKQEDGSYTVEKIIEDGAGEVLSGVTTVVHDVKTGRLFFSSAYKPYIAVCEPK